MEALKKNWQLILIGLGTVILGVVAVITAVKLYQSSQEPIAPTVPLPAPAAEPEPLLTPAIEPAPCSLSFCIEGEVTPTPTPTPTATAAPTPTGTVTPTPTGTITPTPTGTVTPTPVRSVTPTPTVPKVELPEAGIALPTIGAVLGTVILVIVSFLFLF